MKVFLSRIIRAIKLETRLFEEVEADPNSLGQALFVVILSSLAYGIANLSQEFSSSIFSHIISALIGWFIWSYLVFFIGVKWLPEPDTKADYGEVLRTIGFASAPGIIAILGILPLLFSISIMISSLWMLVATIIAVRQVLDYKSTGRAVIVSLLGWIVYVLLNWLFRAIF